MTATDHRRLCPPRLAAAGLISVALLGVTALSVNLRKSVPPPSATATSLRPVRTPSPSAAPFSDAVPAAATPQWSETTHQIRVGNLTRSYLVARPQATSKTPLPVLIVLHGRHATPQIEKERTGLLDVAGRAILVYPEGYQESWNAGACCAAAHDADIDDVAFIKAVVSPVLASQPDAAPHSVFLIGFSNGGKMAFPLLCNEPALFAGVAVVTAVPVSPCPQLPSMPFIQVAWDHDPLLTFSSDEPRKQVNGYPQVSTQEQVAAQRRANGCRATRNQQQRGTLTTTTWSECATGKPVQLAVYQGTTHVWPTGDAATPSAGQVIWDFFRSLQEAQP